ncbi:MAG: RNA polymerase factor sigma-54 [Saprospiraceae bacterium]
MAGLNQNLSQKQLQKLSPQQIQLMKLLQIPTATLEQRIKEELEANPALDEGEDFEEEVEHSEDEFYEEFYGDKKEEQGEKTEKEATEKSETTETNEETYDNTEYEEYEAPKDDEVELDDYIQDYIEDDVANYKLNSNNYSADDEEKTIPIAVQHSFHEYLEEQLGLLNLNEHEEIIAKQVIGSIDDDGYLRREPIALVDDLAFSRNIMSTENQVKAMIKVVQQFEPAGICARDLQESLSIQLHRKLDEQKNNFEEEQILKLAVKAIDRYFDEFAKKHYDKLKRHLGVDEEDLKDVIREIIKLNPKPASGYSTGTDRMTYYIVPDFIIQNRDGELDLTLNSRNAPDLRINDQYKDMLKSYKVTKTRGKRSSKKDREAVMFIKQKIDSAKWFIDAIRQRQQTMLRTMYTIMQFQEDYFLTGDQKTLRPMILKDIADVTGLDISTVSRVANSKYVQTEFGTKRLKDFFSESLQTSSGEEVSTLEVKKILTELIETENKRKPLSDEKLKNALQEKGYNIARRTVAKYREQLNIPVARLRKRLV